MALTGDDRAKRGWRPVQRLQTAHRVDLEQLAREISRE